MTGADPAALRELAQGLTVPTIAEAETGTSVADREDDTWTALDDGWYCPGYEELSTDELEDRGVSITHIPVTVEQLAAVRAALEGAAAELERLDKAREATAEDFGALECRVLELRRELEQARAERDAANAQAAKTVADRIAVAIAHARLSHKRVECGPGVPGCGPDCEGGPDGKPVAFCPTCGPWPCSTAVLLGEVDRLRSDLEAPGSAWAQRAEALAEVARLREALAKARGLNNQMADAAGTDALPQLGMELHDVIADALGDGAAVEVRHG